jgi:hypothetical protein
MEDLVARLRAKGQWRWRTPPSIRNQRSLAVNLTHYYPFGLADSKSRSEALVELVSSLTDGEDPVS